MYASQFLGHSYLYIPVLTSVISICLFVYALISIGGVSYNDNLYGLNVVLEKRRQKQTKAALYSKEYFERKKLADRKNT